MSVPLRLWMTGLLLGTVALLWSGGAYAVVQLCVTVRTEPDGQAGLEKLVSSEVGRHPSHQVVASACESRLIVETFDTAGVRYLTVQLDGDVPERATLTKPEDLASQLSSAVTSVLGNDPVALSQDPERWRAMERVTRTVLIRGVNSYRMELFETAMRTDHNLVFAPGVGLGFARGAEKWRVQARLHLSGGLASASGEDRALQLAAGMDGGVIYEASRRANTSGYFGLGAGIALLRLEGLVEPNDRDSASTVNCVGGTLNLRGGVRFLRIFDFEGDIFAQANLPLSTTKQTDNPLWGDSGPYTPYLQVGVGVGF